MLVITSYPTYIPYSSTAPRQKTLNLFEDKTRIYYGVLILFGELKILQPCVQVQNAVIVHIFNTQSRYDIIYVVINIWCKLVGLHLENFWNPNSNAKLGDKYKSTTFTFS